MKYEILFNLCGYYYLLPNEVYGRELSDDFVASVKLVEQEYIKMQATLRKLSHESD